MSKLPVVSGKEEFRRVVKMRQTLRIALAQINPTVGDLDGNQKRIAEYIDRARYLEADIVVFPELAICGYPPEDLLYKEHFVKENVRILKELTVMTRGRLRRLQTKSPGASSARALTAIIGFVNIDKKKNLYNAAAIIHDGQLKGIIRKQDLPNYGVFDEKRYFTPGQKNGLFSWGEISFGVNICEDIWKNDGLSVQQAKAGARLLINISSSPYHDGKIKIREKMLRSRARQTGAFVCYTNLVGGQDELVFDGASMILNPEGKILACARQFEEDLLVADLNLRWSKQKRNSSEKIIALAVSSAKFFLEKKTIEQRIHPLLEPLAEVYQALVLGTRDYVRKNDFNKVVVGLSGGIDSALVAVIARDALGKENVVGVSMPSRFSSQETKSDAQILANNLGIQFMQVSIEEIFNSYLSVLHREFSDRPLDVTEENLQARIRGNILMAFSNKFGWLVLTTGNKSEIAVGFCTLYGDMSGGFAVIKDVPKTKVYELTRFRNSREKTPLIPASILDRAPTAELRENQKDQDSLPPYEVLDPLLKSYVEEHHSFAQVWKETARKKDLADRDIPRMIKEVIRMVDKSEYKRRQAPPGIKISPRAFGKDWRLPITNRYKEF